MLKVVMQIDPNRNSAYYNRGIAKRNAGFAEEAIADYDIAIQLNPDDYFSYNNRGGCAIRKGLLQQGKCEI